METIKNERFNNPNYFNILNWYLPSYLW